LKVPASLLRKRGLHHAMLVFARTHLRGALTTEPSLLLMEGFGCWMVIEVDMAAE
jgi:hypothetical protein